MYRSISYDRILSSIFIECLIFWSCATSKFYFEDYDIRFLLAVTGDLTKTSHLYSSEFSAFFFGCFWQCCRLSIRWRLESLSKFNIKRKSRRTPGKQRTQCSDCILRNNSMQLFGSEKQANNSHESVGVEIFSEL